MTGLIWKDFLCLRKGFSSTLVVMGIYLALSFTGTFALSFIAALIVVLLTILPLNCFAYDSAANWDVYARTLPVGTGGIVAARYITVLLLSAAGFCLALLAGAAGAALGKVDDWWAFLATCAALFLFSLVINAVMMPLLYRFGAERARIVFYGVIGGFLLLGLVVFAMLGGEEFLEGLDQFPLPPTWMLALPALGAAALLGVSFLLSRWIYRQSS